MKSIKHHAVVAGIVIGLASVLGCSSGSGSPTPAGAEGVTGTVGMQLQIAPGVTINTINWAITNSVSGLTQSGSVNVQQ
jgi:hypothetical protein